MKVKSFDRPTVKALRSDLDIALAKVAKQYGIEISTGTSLSLEIIVQLKLKQLLSVMVVW